MFKRVLLIIKYLVLLVMIPLSCNAAEKKFMPSMLRDGDLIFQSTQSSQSEAVKLATNSKFSHMGVIFKKGNRYMVYEAINPVSVTPFEKFVSRSGGRFVVRRLKDRDRLLTEEVLDRMKSAGRSYLGKRYDIHFRWDDSRIYCSELVWKIYKIGAGIEIGAPQKAGDLNLGNPVVQKLIKRRFGKEVPLDEIIISPQKMFDSDKLVTVIEK